MAEELKGVVRLVDKDVAGNIPIQHALTKVRGVSFMLANALCSVLKLDRSKKVGYMNQAEIKKIEDCLKSPIKHGIPGWLLNRRKDIETGEDTHLISGELILKQKFDIRDMQKIKSYKGLRHSRGQKVRGQRTKSTGRKGRTLGVKRKKLSGKK